ncbi:hypothetical protein BGZ96_008666 [Linnemannia gamsii]|uniref:HIG1 domain-containing protein n=1 Tax=Linnemannia gamsii TaxID=64522 RepID=A0ABQ7JYS9_9FUNG|nr:hypothetical protein BGZ96_008666 [Linnemannia gamsii]
MAATMQEFEHFKNPHLKVQENRDQLIGIAAAKGAALALVAGGLIAFSGPRYSKAYQTASPRLKQFVLGSGTVATSILFADHARVQYEDRQLLRHLDQEAAENARAEIRAKRGVMAEVNYQVRENRNTVVAVSWLTCMAGSLLYTFSKKGLTTTQRIVTARMYAQGFTVLTMMAVAAIELTDDGAHKTTSNTEVMTDQWKAILAKDNQGNFIVKDTTPALSTPVKAAAAASLSA